MFYQHYISYHICIYIYIYTHTIHIIIAPYKSGQTQQASASIQSNRSPGHAQHIGHAVSVFDTAPRASAASAPTPGKLCHVCQLSRCSTCGLAEVDGPNGPIPSEPPKASIPLSYLKYWSGISPNTCILGILATFFWGIWNIMKLLTKKSSPSKHPQTVGFLWPNTGLLISFISSTVGEFSHLHCLRRLTDHHHPASMEFQGTRCLLLNWSIEHKKYRCKIHLILG